MRSLFEKARTEYLLVITSGKARAVFVKLVPLFIVPNVNIDRCDETVAHCAKVVLKCAPAKGSLAICTAYLVP